MELVLPLMLAAESLLTLEADVPSRPLSRSSRFSSCRCRIISGVMTPTPGGNMAPDRLSVPATANLMNQWFNESIR